MILKTISHKPSLLVYTLLLLIIAPSSYASQWKIQPTVEARAGYSDNIEFDNDDDDDESGYIGQVNPGILIQKDAGRLRVRLDYLMQNFYYVDEKDLNTDHNLDSIARYEFIPQTFFLNGYANIQKVLVDSRQGINIDNLNNTGNTTDETTVGIEPVWVQNIGSYAQANLAYLYAEQSFGDEEDIDEEEIDDNDRQRFLASMGNRDPESDRLDWMLGYKNEQVNFDEGEEYEFIYQQLELGYDIGSRMQVVGTYGYEDNDFGDIVSIDDEDGSGTYWDLGFIYGLGEFTALEIRRGERFFGNTWKGVLTVGGPKLKLNASYQEEVDLDVLDSIDTENGFIKDQDLLQNDIDTDASNNRDSVGINKAWEGTIAYQVSKSTFAFNFTNEDIEFLDSNDKEKNESYALGWLWNFSAISSLLTRVEYQEDNINELGIEETTDLVDFQVKYTKNLSAKTDFDIDYIYSEGDSDIDDDEDFTSNTISVGLIHRF